MPSSYVENVPLITHLMEALSPQSMLDVGPGYGKYGFLFRERVDDFTLIRRLDGIDPFPDYILKADTRRLYNDFWAGVFLPGEPLLYVARDSSIREEYETLTECMDQSYDLILMVDVLEHYDEDDGFRALDYALDLAPKVLISTPLGYPQGAVGGNKYERHLSEWPAEKIRKAGHFHDLSGQMGATANSIIGVLSE